ncbi:MAG: PH domain-containing protein [Alphaproteobacteria bacterium]|nr:PH domain-containing protein [Alphaproteobacteria bacterium]
MAYVHSVLQPGETIKVIGRFHWVIFVRSVLVIIAGALILSFSSKAGQKMTDILVITGWIVVGLGALMFLRAWMKRSMTELSVTNHRVIFKRGFIWRHTVEMNMDKVETVDVGQSILGRILGYGTIRILGTGQGIEGLEKVGSPIELRSAITAR